MCQVLKVVGSTCSFGRSRQDSVDSSNSIYCIFWKKTIKGNSHMRTFAEFAALPISPSFSVPVYSTFVNVWFFLYYCFISDYYFLFFCFDVVLLVWKTTLITYKVVLKKYTFVSHNYYFFPVKYLERQDGHYVCSLFAGIVWIPVHMM